LAKTSFNKSGRGEEGKSSLVLLAVMKISYISGSYRVSGSSSTSCVILSCYSICLRQNRYPSTRAVLCFSKHIRKIKSKCTSIKTWKWFHVYDLSLYKNASFRWQLCVLPIFSLAWGIKT
jgi:hypothetical protein